jgi:hypothetical protein
MLYLFWSFSHFGLAVSALVRNPIYFRILSLLFAGIFFGIFLSLDFFTDLLVYESFFNSPYEVFHFAPAWTFIARLADLLSIPADYRLICVQIFLFIIILSVCSAISFKSLYFILLAPALYVSMFNSLGQGVASFFITYCIISFSRSRRVKSFIIGILATTFHLSSPFFIATYLFIRLADGFLKTLPSIINGRINRNFLPVLVSVIMVVLIFAVLSGYLVRFLGYLDNVDYQGGRLSPTLKSIYYGIILAPTLLLTVKCVELTDLLKFSYGLLFLVFVTSSIGAYELSSRISIQIACNLPFIAFYLFSLGFRRSASFLIFMMGLSTQATSLVIP